MTKVTLRSGMALDRSVGLGSNLDQIGPKWDKSGTLRSVSVYFGSIWWPRITSLALGADEECSVTLKPLRASSPSVEVSRTGAAKVSRCRGLARRLRGVSTRDVC